MTLRPPIVGILLAAGCFSQPPAPDMAGLPYAEPRHTLFAGGKHACSLRDNGVAYCWGDNSDGQLGVPAATTPYSSTPVGVQDSLDGWTDFAVGGRHSCGIQNGYIHCFGANDHSQSQGTQPINELMLPSGAASRVFAGDDGTCAIDTAGALWCWGHLDIQTGDLSAPTQISPLGVDGPWASISLAYDHACARRADYGDIVCWGDDDQDQLAVGDLQPRTPRTAVGPDGPFVAVASGNGVSCGIEQHGSLACWGTTAATTVGTTTYQVVDDSANGRTWTSIAVDSHHLCGVANGQVHCYGDDDTGDAGRGDFQGHTDAPGPQIMANATEVAVGDGFSCARDATGAVRCWGSNIYGELGTGSIATARDPVHVALGGQVKAVTLGWGHTCAMLSSSGDMYCWGDNATQQVAAGAAQAVTTPMKVTSGVDAIAAGSHQTCSHATGSMTVRCWGGQSNQTLPIVPSILAAGDDATCAAGVGSVSAYCWGSVPADPDASAHAVTNASSPVGVAVGGGFAAVIDNINTGTWQTFLWGTNCALGGSAVAPASATANTTIDTPYVSLAQAGEGHGCYEIAATHDLECWGANDYSQVTSQTSICETTPVAVAVGGGIAWRSPPALAVAGNHSCALDAMGVLYCWGDNRDFALSGDVPADIVRGPMPVAMHPIGQAGALAWDAIATGPHDTCAITPSPDSQLWCWGLNHHGEVGNGSSFVAAPPAGSISLP